MSFALLSNRPAVGSMYYILLPGLLSLVDSQTAILSQTHRKSQEGETYYLLERGCSCQAIFSDLKNNHSNFFKDPNNQLPYCTKKLIYSGYGIEYDMLLKFQTENKFLGT